MYKKMINFIIVKCPTLYGHCVSQQFKNYHAEHYHVTGHFSFLSLIFSDALRYHLPFLWFSLML